jgi:hypothetical protein
VMRIGHVFLKPGTCEHMARSISRMSAT